MKLSQALDSGTRSVTRVDASRVRLVWASGYWDGPLSGIAELDDDTLWFHFADEESEEDPTWYRRFYLVRLPPGRLDTLLEEHAAFQRHVGTHFDYGPDGARNPDGLRPRSEWSKFYDVYPTEGGGDYLDCEVVGWFEL